MYTRVVYIFALYMSVKFNIKTYNDCWYDDGSKWQTTEWPMWLNINFTNMSSTWLHRQISHFVILIFNSHFSRIVLHVQYVYNPLNPTAHWESRLVKGVFSIHVGFYVIINDPYIIYRRAYNHDRKQNTNWSNVNLVNPLWNKQSEV